MGIDKEMKELQDTVDNVRTDMFDIISEQIKKQTEGLRELNSISKMTKRMVFWDIPVCPKNLISKKD